jgi:predicted Zn-dependent protease with MMP-like domain
MNDMPDEEFSRLIAECLDELPEQYVTGLKNVLITYEDTATEEQRNKQRLHMDQTLLGLYEGIPLTKRAMATSITSGQLATMPDRITIFKHPLLRISNGLDDLRARVKHTLWHEIAHYYGLDHDRIHEIERNWV